MWNIKLHTWIAMPDSDGKVDESMARCSNDDLHVPVAV